MQLVVTGSTGYIGRHFVEEVGDRPEIRLYCVGRGDNPFAAPIRWVRADLGRPGWTSALPSRADAVLHLAQSKRYRDFPEGSSDVVAINVAATVELADWARTAGVSRFLFSSTGSVYGDTPSPAIEDDLTNARTIYAASKLCAELLLRPYAAFYNVIVARLFGVYGPMQSATFISNIIGRIMNGDEVTLANGIGVRMNPLYIDDCVTMLRGLCEISMQSSYEIYNLAGAEIIDLSDLVRHVEAISARKARTRRTDEAPVRLVGDRSKLAALLKELPSTPIEEGLRRTIAAFASAP